MADDTSKQLDKILDVMQDTSKNIEKLLSGMSGYGSSAGFKVELSGDSEKTLQNLPKDIVAGIEQSLRKVGENGGSRSNSTPAEVSVNLDAGEVAEALSKAILAAQNRPATIDVKMDSLVAEIRNAFLQALAQLNLSADVNLRAVDIDMSPVQEKIQSVLETALSNLNIQVPITLDTEKLAASLVRMSQPSIRRWNHEVVRTKNAPDEQLLDKYGFQGFELINTIYDIEQSAYISYFKKLVTE